MGHIEREISNERLIANELHKYIAQYGKNSVSAAIGLTGLTFNVATQANHAVPSLTIDAFFNRFLSSGTFLSLAKTTQATYKTEVNVLTAYCKTRMGKDAMLKDASVLVEPDFLQKYLATAKSARTFNKRSAFLRKLIGTVLGKEVKEQLKEVLVFSRTDKDLPTSFSEAQLNDVLRCAKRRQTGLRDHAMLVTLAGSGIRVNELTGLQIQDIDFQKGTLMVYPKRGKNKKEPRLIQRNALAILQHFIEFTYSHLEDLDPEMWVFSGRSNERMSDRAVQKMVRRVIEQSEAFDRQDKERFNVHSFRHTFAMILLINGVNIYTISKLLGHESIESTTIYLRLYDDQLRDAIERHPFAQIDATYIRHWEENSYE